MTKAPKKKCLEKCFVCTHSYKAEEIDEHMNGITHHFVLEQLYKKSRPHHCLVCGCVWNGLTLYRQHVASAEHKKKIVEMAKTRRKGTPVSFMYTTPPDLIHLCIERDRRNSANKAKRRQERIRVKKARQQEKVWASKQAQLVTTHQHYQQNKENKNSTSLSLDNEPRGRTPSPESPRSSLNEDWDRPTLHQEVSSSQVDEARTSRAGSVCSEPHSSHNAGSKEQGRSAQSVGSGNQQSASQFFSEIDFSLDFTSDLLPPVGVLLFAPPPAVKAKPPKGKTKAKTKAKAKESNHTSTLSTGSDCRLNASLQGKSSRHMHGSRKRPLSQSEVPPSSSADQNRQGNSPRAPGLVKAHVQHISTILRRIRRSLDEEGLANPQPPSNLTTGDGVEGNNGSELTGPQPPSTLTTGDDVEGNNMNELTGFRKQTSDQCSKDTGLDEHFYKKLKTMHYVDGHSYEEETSVGPSIGSPSSSATMEPASGCGILQSLIKFDYEDEYTRVALQSRQSLKSSTENSDDPPPSQSRPGLPELLKRAKSAAHEPNLTLARRVRTVSSSQTSEVEKEAPAGLGLKPTLEKLINSTVAKRKVNWKELFQEYHRKKRLKEKGMPRFGIELGSPVMPLPDQVMPLPDHLHLEEVQEMPLGEDFQWDSVDFDASCLSVSCEDPPPEDPYPEAPVPSAGQGNRDFGLQRLVEAFVKMEEDNWDQRDSQDYPPPAEQTCQGIEDPPRPDQAKPRKERQVDELLAVSLSEQELSSSLLTLDDSLTQARSALQAAYVNVQRLLVVREQTTNDINALRTKRIEILRVMRGGCSSDNAEEQTPKPSSEGCTQPALLAPAPESPDDVPHPAPSSVWSSAQPTEPIKEEPVSPACCQDPETISVSH